jgi:DHA3 family macrolide efflux protein-like MFS transporter
MATVINFVLNPAMTLMPLLVTQYFGGGAFDLGWLESAWGFGMVVGGLILGVWGGFRRRVVTSLLGLIGMGLGILLVGLTPAALFGLAVGALFLAGFMNPMCNGPLLAIVQARVAPEMQGRVFTVMMSASGAISPIAMVIAGPVADRFGVRLWYVMGGVMCIVMAVVALFLPAIMRMEERPAAAPAAEPAGLVVSAGE